MRFLVYCIFHGSSQNAPDPLAGIAGESVFRVAANGLTAAVSVLAHSRSGPDIPDILAFENVIESFHREHTVIPMRYGCLFEREAHIVRHVEEHSARYEAMLEELDGLVEMGIRVLLPNGEGLDMEGPFVEEPFRRESSSSRAHTGGAAYLAARRNQYAEKDRLVLRQDTVLNQICGRMSRFSVRSKRETSASNGLCLLSAYFLVRRGSVEAFRGEFRGIVLDKPAKLLLSGPWPAYNFVSSEGS